ncbi:MAG: molecular chaperone Hsp90 [Streptomycetaceae bacterium]|nr:molecular chaperone Hsp90 [Streptomycetaceae bacterium]
MVRGSASHPEGGGADPFGTARLRRGVLDAWTASPARFREDANAEEDLALGGYRDRLVVELAQNAADAAVRAGVPGRLRLTLHPAQAPGEPAVLAAANTGAPLDAAGVESLSTLRASAKREKAATAVGRFGVGFSAVLAVSDEPAIIGRSGGVRWSLAEARELTGQAAAANPTLADELRRRDGHVPLLRLPLSAEGTAPEGYDTVVVLPLRDGTAEDLASRLLAGIDDALLLTLPGLTEIVIETPDTTRTLTQRQIRQDVVVEDTAADSATRWRIATAGGPLMPTLLEGRPVEERLRPYWQITWAVPVGIDGAPDRPRTAPVVHAHTPTDEPLGVPALLIASYPLDPTRRHVAPGPLADFITERAAETYTALLAEWQPITTGTIDLVPGPLGRGELDAELRRKLLDRLPGTAFLPRAADEDTNEKRLRGPMPAEPDGEAEALRPDRAELIEGASAATVTVLSEVFPSLLPAGLERRAELRSLGVARIPLGDAIDRLAGTERPPHWWHRLYDALCGTDPDRLSGLPVPLTDGRTIVGPRQILLPLPGDHLPEGISRLGLKVAHPEAAHPLLEKLGALPATPRAVLTSPQVRTAVAASLDEGEVWYAEGDVAAAPDAEELAEIVLTLVRNANLSPGDEPWLGALALPDDEGELTPASELLYPGSPFEEIIRADEMASCDPELAERWGEQPLTAVGVLATFALVRAGDVVLDPDDLLEPREGDWAEPDDVGLLDAVDVWCEDVLDQLPDTEVPPVATEITGVRDLDLVDDDAWPQALAMLARPPLRDAITAPVRVLLPDGTTQSVRPHAAWWLRDHPVLDGRRPVGLRASGTCGGDPLLVGLYDEAETGQVDEEVLRALGVRTSVAALLDEPGGPAELLARLATPERPVTASQLRALYAAFCELDPEAVTLPNELRAVVDGRLTVVDAADALVTDAPDLLPLAAGRPLLPAGPRWAAELAELFQVRRLSEEFPAPVTTHGEPRYLPDAVRELLPAAPASYIEHEQLLVEAGESGIELDWRYVDGVLHASTLEGVAAGLAWAAGAWQRRFEVAALLEDPSRTEELSTARWFD